MDFSTFTTAARDRRNFDDEDFYEPLYQHLAPASANSNAHAKSKSLSQHFCCEAMTSY